ncbi:MAG: hypothetical protein JW959_14700 [Pirellulales bacterium]|nr:hypothetical protein [Pirellulales bacterium]
MKTINVEGLPEPVVRSLEVVVKAVREQVHTPVNPRPPVDLPIWPGKVIGDLTRRELYEDVR